MKRHLVVFFILVISTSCFRKKQISDTEFITFIHEKKIPSSFADQSSSQYSRLLIKKIFEPSWEIVYGIASHCPASARTTKAKAQLKEAIEKALLTWLEPLRSLATLEIVAHFTYTELFPIPDPKYYNSDEYQEKFADEQIKNIDAQLQIIFYCSAEERSFIYWKIPQIHLFFGKDDKDAIFIPGTQYKATTLLHEIGHALGLSDTYVEEDEKLDRHGITSSGGLDITVGMQPASVMAGFGFPSSRQGNDAALSEDDIKGLKWLYKYYYEESVDLRDCPSTDYKFEVIDEKKGISGCRPKHPLIFESRQGHSRAARWIIQNSTDIDINAQDEHGNTALHYAAKHGDCELVKELLSHHNIGTLIANKDGYVPLQYAENKKHYKLEKLLQGNTTVSCTSGRKTKRKKICAGIGVGNSHYPVLIFLLVPFLILVVMSSRCSSHKKRGEASRTS